jgi:acetoin utilization deacetylase AcuC-like enzyme
MYHQAYEVPLSPHHPFPMSKYPLLKARLLAEKIISSGDLVEPPPLNMTWLELVHTRDYLHKLSSSTLSAAEIRRLGLPWSEALWQRSLLAASGTLTAARAALSDGLAANLAGGTHHAFADHGEGFCVLNDVALALTVLRTEGTIHRGVVIDLDVHQGNGTAAIFEQEDAIYTFSMHGERNYPIAKMRSNLDVPLRDGLGDAEYLDQVATHLSVALDQAAPEIAFYLAGVDVVAGDRYGRLALSESGVAQRDRFVIETVRGRGIPLVIVLAGGYAATRERTAELHTHAFRAAAEYERETALRQALPSAL